MNRRNLLKSVGALFTVALLPITLPLAACSFSVSGTLSVIIGAVQGILKYVAGSAPWATDLSAALNALQQAEATWQSGGAVAIIIDALNTLEAVCAVIPLTMIYSPLIDLIVTGIEAVINYFNPPVASLSRPRATLLTNPHMGRIALKTPGSFETQQGSFKQQYNDVATGLGLTQLKIA
jgi:hypothetical protein